MATVRARPAAATAAYIARSAVRPAARRLLLPRTVLLIAAAGVFMEFVDTTIVNVAFADIRRSFPTAGIGELSWVFNAYTIVFGAFLVAAGRIADLLGRKRLFLVGVGIFTASSALCAVAPSAPFLIAARALQATGGAIVVPSSLAMIVHAFPPEQRARAVSTWGAAAALAAALGPPLGGLLIKLDDWRLAFLVNVPIGIVVLLIASRVLVESRSAGRRTLPDLLGAAALALGIGTLTLGIVEGGSWGWGSVRTLGAFAGSLAFGCWFLWRSSWHRSPVLDRALFGERQFTLANAAILVAGMGFYASLLCHVLFLIVVWHYSALQAGSALVPAALIAAVVAGSAGRIADRHGFRVLVVPGALVWAGAFAYYRLRIGLHPAFFSQWLPGGVLAGIGIGLTMPQLSGQALAAAPGTRFSTAAALNSAGRQIGGALGIAIMVLILTGHPTASHFRAGWVYVACCFAVVAALAVGFGHARTLEKTPAPEPAEPGQDGAPEVLTSPPRRESNGHPTVVAPLAPLPRDSLSLLRRVRVLAEIPDQILRELAAQAQPVAIRAGDWLFHQDDPSEAVYVVVTGRIEVIIERPDLGQVDVLGAGAVLGELGVLAGEGRSASARALRDGHLLSIDRGAFASVIRESPEAALAMTRSLAAALQQSRGVAERRSAGRPGTVACLAVGADAPVQAAAALLGDSMTGAAIMSCPSAARDSDLASRAVELLDAAERRQGQVLLVVASEDPARWRDFCLRQADHLILVGGTAAPPEGVAMPTSRCDLILPAEVDPSRWLAGAAVDRIRRLGSPGGIEALGRVLAGRGLGLVLSGGGARAMAHIGALEELTAAGLRFDRLGGSGFGAVCAAMVAAGMTPGEIDAILYEELVRHQPLRDYTLPRVALLRGRKLKGTLERIFGDARIEELERDFFCLSADLISGERVIHRAGSVTDALLSTVATPGLLPPVSHDSRLLVDGGILDNLPVDVMRAAGEGPIVAIDASGRRAGPVLIEPSSRTRGNGHEEGLPSITETLSRTMTLASLARADSALGEADLSIVPDTGAIGALEFHQLDALRESGRTAARLALANPGPWAARPQSENGAKP